MRTAMNALSPAGTQWLAIPRAVATTSGTSATSAAVHANRDSSRGAVATPSSPRRACSCDVGTAYVDVRVIPALESTDGGTPASRHVAYAMPLRSL